MKAKQKHEEAELKSKAGDEEGAKSLLTEEEKLLEEKESIEDAKEMYIEQKEMFENALATQDVVFRIKETNKIIEKANALIKGSKKEEKK